MFRSVLDSDMSALSPLASEFATTEEAEAYERWFRAKVEAAMADDGPDIPHDEAMATVRNLIESRLRAASDLEK